VAIAGFLKSFSLKSEVRSHDAKTAANARPNGHISIGLRVLQCWSKRGLHIQQQGRNTISGRLSNDFRMARIALSDLRAVLD
jgi:hypothetical protein